MESGQPVCSVKQFLSHYQSCWLVVWPIILLQISNAAIGVWIFKLLPALTSNTGLELHWSPLGWGWCRTSLLKTKNGGYGRRRRIWSKLGRTFACLVRFDVVLASSRQAKDLLHVETLRSGGSVTQALGREEELTQSHATTVAYRISALPLDRVGARD